MHVVRPTRELVIDVALAVLDHSDHRRLRQHLAGGLGGRQPAARLLLVGRACLMVRHRAVGAVDHRGTDQPDQPALLGIHRNHRVQQHADVGPVADRAKAALGAAVGSVIQLRGIGDRQDVPPDGAPGGLPGGMHQHLVHADRLVVEETLKLAGLAAAVGQCREAHGALLLHRPQQAVADRGQAAIAKVTKLRLVVHANRLRWVVGRERI